MMAVGTLSEQQVGQAANSLLEAYRTRAPIPPLTDQYRGATVTDAYRIQQYQIRAWTAAGDPVRGHKIGLASHAMQQQMGVHEPDFGHLTSHMFLSEHQPIDCGAFLQPRIEPEVAFVLKAPLRGPGVHVADAARAVDFVLPALEIVDSRIREWKISIFDTVADNASSGAVILGSTPAWLSDVDLSLAGCVLSKGGLIVETGAAAAVLGSPLNALAWLANTIGAMGVRLEPGHTVLSGSMTRALPASAGDSVTASIGGIGTVTAVFADPPWSTVADPIQAGQGAARRSGGR